MDKADKGLIWAAALAAGAVAYAGLLAVHLSTSTSGSAALRAGEMVPIAGVSAVAVALIAQATSAPRVRSWWVISLAVLVTSTLWYIFVEVAPRATRDARAEASGETDDRLIAPDRAGQWKRLDGAGATKREQDLLAKFDRAAKDKAAGLTDAIYGEYRSRTGWLVFVGFNTSGEAADSLRGSSRDALRDFMTGVGAKGPEWVEPGNLGGSMACTRDVTGMPEDMLFCAWAGTSTIGQVTIAQPDLGLEGAATITRKLRKHATEQ